MENTVLNSELISAYEATYFHVQAPSPFILKVGYKSSELEALFDLTGCKTAAFITAFNPFSETLSEKENQARNNQLEADLNRLNLKYINGFGQDPHCKWPGEDSYLVLDLDLEYAKFLAIKFEQNAIVWCSSSAVPELVLLK